MSNHLSTTPMDPYAWRESVLSTRSLSYISNAGGLATPSLTGGMHSRDTSHTYFRAPSTRRSTITDFSEDGDLEMADAKKETSHGLLDIQELPDSVAGSLLFELPREIRDRIYGFCLTAQGNTPVEWPFEPSPWRAYHLQPQLLRTCKIIHDEAAPLLYSLNRMNYHHPSDANMFVRVMASRAHACQISQLSLHIKAQDMRIWMPYLTSTDEVRNLKADFPHLKELNIRFRSNKWMHGLPPEVNLKNWSEDSRLDELIDGLRHVFFPGKFEERTTDNDGNAMYTLFNSVGIQLHGTEDLRKQLVDLQKSRVPTIRVCCACRVHSTHFNALTNPTVPVLLPASDGEPDRFVPHPQVPPPVVEGELFRGFTSIDLQNGVKKLHDSELGSASVARTPYADKIGILLSLEIHCLDPRRDLP